MTGRLFASRRAGRSRLRWLVSPPANAMAVRMTTSMMECDASPESGPWVVVVVVVGWLLFSRAWMEPLTLEPSGPVTLTASGPLAVAATSNSTLSPSPRDGTAFWRLLLAIFRLWTKMSLLPSAGVMKPYPLFTLYHFTCPAARMEVAAGMLVVGDERQGGGWRGWPRI